MKRRMFTLSAFCPMAAIAQPDRLIPSSPVDNVAIYVIPTDGFPESLAADISRALTKATGLWVKASGSMPAGSIEPFAGTNQYPAEDYLPLGIATSKQLPDTSARTYFIVLTDRDINAKSRNFRYQFSLHSPMARTSVLSVARLLYEKDGSVATTDVIGSRVQKMLLRIAGEMKLGWKRSNDPTDVMYSPLMSVDDVDRMSILHTVTQRKPTS